MKNADMPAMPLSGDAYIDFAGYEEGKSSYNPECQGLTKREMFAMHAMQGILSNSASNYIGYTDWEKLLAENSVKAADALIAELDE